MAKVRANQRGYYGRMIREPGDVFEAEGKALWFDPVDAAEGDEAPKRKGKPKAEDKAPEPVRVTNEVAEATGSTQPDWVAG